MIKYDELQKNIKKGIFESCYLFCGYDEQLMKEVIEEIIKKNVDPNFLSLNSIQLDGNTVSYDDIVNACETFPFMSDKKVVVVYRAAFLEDGGKKKKSDLQDSDIESDNERETSTGNDKGFSQISKYIQQIPEHCILIVYQVFKDDREKPGSKITKLDKKICVVKFDKLKGDSLEKKVKAYFEENGKSIEKAELKLFCESLENNMEIIKNEVDKICCYVEGKEIKKEDIKLMVPPKMDSDIFDLVDYIAQKKFERALSIMNELIYKGENLLKILYMIERQFKLLLNIKLGLENGKSKELLTKELSLNPYIYDKMVVQCRRFSEKQLIRAVNLCLNSEEKLKSSSVNAKTEMELLIINSIAS